ATSSGDASTLQRGAAQRARPSTSRRYVNAARATTPSQFSSDFIFGHFTSSRTCATMLTRAVSEGDAARAITASHLPARTQDEQAFGEGGEGAYHHTT